MTKHHALLDGVRVLDLTDEKGLFCGKVLGDFGADVIKIERPGGDPARNIGPFYKDIPDPEKSLFWFATNTSKRGITLNIEVPDGQELFKKLVEKADIVVESFDAGLHGLHRPGLRRPQERSSLTSSSPRSRPLARPALMLTTRPPISSAPPWAAWPASWATWAARRCAWAPTPSPTSTPGCRARWAP